MSHALFYIALTRHTWLSTVPGLAQSARKDITTGPIVGDRIRQDGVDYFDTIDEEWISSKPRFREWAHELFSQLPRIYLDPQGRIMYFEETNLIE